MDHVVAVSRNGRAGCYPLADIPAAPRLGGVGRRLWRDEMICGLLTHAAAFGLTSWGRLVELELATLAVGDEAAVVALEEGEALLTCWPANR